MNCLRPWSKLHMYLRSCEPDCQKYLFLLSSPQQVYRYCLKSLRASLKIRTYHSRICQTGFITFSLNNDKLILYSLTKITFSLNNDKLILYSLTKGQSF